MATTPGRVAPEVPFHPSQPPVIEGFSPSVFEPVESVKDKFVRKTRENPLVPIGKREAGTIEEGDGDVGGSKSGRCRARGPR